MKKICLVFMSAIFVVSQVHAQSLIFRAPSASLTHYQKTVAASTFRISPIDALETKLQAAELSPSLRRDLETMLGQNAKAPEGTKERIENFLEKMNTEPWTLAVRENRIALIERLLAFSPSTRWQRQLEILQKGNAVVWTHKQTLLQIEIQKTQNLWRTRAGGEDVVVFWNGKRLQDNDVIFPDDEGQWILVSSQWKPKFVYGTWDKAVQAFNEPAQNWVGGSCESPEFYDLGFANGEKSAFFSENCVSGAGVRSIAHETTFSSVKMPRNYDVKKTLLWSAALVGLGFLALSASGKTLRISR